MGSELEETEEEMNAAVCIEPQVEIEYTFGSAFCPSPKNNEIGKSKKNNRVIDYDELLLFFGISSAAVFGAYLRVGITYFRVWHIETNYCVMYAQIIGCVIMGILLKFKAYFMGNSRYPPTRYRRLLYTILSSGLCGSITTFSTWQIECNKSLFIQADISWGNIMGTYNGARMLEWGVCLWIGVALPLMALHFGIYLAEILQEEQKVSQQDGVISTEVEPKEELKSVYEEVFLFAVFCITCVLSIGLPLLVFPTWIHLTYTAVFGILGAYLRYWLSSFNKIYKSFPMGTFAANIGGSWVLAGTLAASKFGVEYYNVGTQAALFGISCGFCGCLSTISTFVSEIDSMPNKHAYRYGIVSNLMAQAGIILIYNVYAWSVIPQSVLTTPPINFCTAQRQLCIDLLAHIDGCQGNIGQVNICADDSDYNSFVGYCSCGNYSFSRPEKVLIDAQVKANASNAMVFLWPSDALTRPGSASSCEVIDYCLSYENICNHLLNRMGCPADLRHISGCDRKGLTGGHVSNVCHCASYQAQFTSIRIMEIIVDVSLQRRYDLLAYRSWPTVNSISFDSAFLDTCLKALEHLQCPVHLRTISANSIPGNYSTWKGECICNGQAEEGHLDISVRVGKNLFDGLVLPTAFALMHRPNPTLPIFDMCQSVFNFCKVFLDKIDCPLSQQVNIPCNGKRSNNHRNETDSYPLGLLNTSTIAGTKCRCAALTFLDDRAAELFQNAILAERLNKEYMYIPPAQAAYSLVMASDPFKQLSQPHFTLPST